MLNRLVILVLVWKIIATIFRNDLYEMNISKYLGQHRIGLCTQ